MRYRNDTALDVTVHLDPPVTVPPDGEIDSDIHIVGLTLLEDPPAGAEAVPVEAPTTPATKSSKAAKDGAQ